MEFLVVTVCSQQFLVSAALNDFAVVKHADLISILNRAQTVGDSHSGACLHQSLQCILYESLALGVQPLGTFVEEKRREILQNGSGNRRALALTARQPLAAIADIRVETML